MKKVLPILVLLILGVVACTPTSLKPVKEKKITAYMTRSNTVRVIGERGAVKKGSEVLVRGPDGQIASKKMADKYGGFDFNFCAGPWARENLDCEYQGDVEVGDYIRVEYKWEKLTSPPTLVQVK
jgi:hypothetical protein